MKSRATEDFGSFPGCCRDPGDSTRPVVLGNSVIPARTLPLTTRYLREGSNPRRPVSQSVLTEDVSEEDSDAITSNCPPLPLVDTPPDQGNIALSSSISLLCPR